MRRDKAGEEEFRLGPRPYCHGSGDIKYNTSAYLYYRDR